MKFEFRENGWESVDDNIFVKSEAVRYAYMREMKRWRSQKSKQIHSKQKQFKNIKFTHEKERREFADDEKLMLTRLRNWAIHVFIGFRIYSYANAKKQEKKVW